MNFLIHIRKNSIVDNLADYLAPPMPACRYVEENGFAAMLVSKRSVREV